MAMPPVVMMIVVMMLQVVLIMMLLLVMLMMVITPCFVEARLTLLVARGAQLHSLKANGTYTRMGSAYR